MNKNRYRVIFCKSSQVFKAVAENVKSKGKSKRVSESKNSENTESHTQTFEKSMIVKTITILTSLLMPLQNIHAQIQVDTSAAANNKPMIGVGTTQGGTQIPVVNIQTPTNGVSHNKYTQFDILSGGMVLNNSRTGSTTQLVGNVAANPFLQTGEARVILNEVNSAAATRFEGNLEVAGQMADVIIANPSGINVKGGGFINVNKATIATGKVTRNSDGSLGKFEVVGGKVSVENNSNYRGLGEVGYDSTYLDIYTKLFEINGTIKSKSQIAAVLGNNTIDNNGAVVSVQESSAVAPIYSFDMKNLGSMRSESIFINSTEKGVGVINAGNIAAFGNIYITANGEIINNSSIYSSGFDSGVYINNTNKEKDIINNRLIHSNGEIYLNSAKDIKLSGGALFNFSKNINKDFNIQAQGTVKINAETDIKNLTQGGDVNIISNNIDFGYSSRDLHAEGDLNLIANKINIENSAKLTAKNNINISTKEELIAKNLVIKTTEGNLNIENKSNLNISNSNLSINGDINLKTDRSINLKDLSFTATNGIGNLKSFNAYALDDFTWNQGTNLSFYKYNGNFNVLAGDQFSSNIRNFDAAGNVNITAINLTPVDSIKSGGAVSISAKNSDLIIPNIEASKDIQIINREGNISSKAVNLKSTDGKISIIANKNIDIKPDYIIEPAPYADHDGKTTIKNKIKSKGDLTLASLHDGVVKIGASSITSDNLVNISTVGLININGDMDYRLPGGDTAYSTLVTTDITAKGINIISKSNDIFLDSTNILAGIDGIKTTSINSNIDYSKFSSLGNIEVSATKSLSVNSSHISADKHLAFNGGENIRFNSFLDTYGLLKYNPVISNINANGMLSLTSKGDIVLNNLNLYGASKLKAGGILIETDKNLVNQQGLTLEAVGNPLFKLDTDLAGLDGSVTVRNANSIVLDNNYKVNATGNIDLYSTAGDLVIKGTGGTNGQNSAQVQSLSTAGSISLVGNNVKVEGANIDAGKDINIVAKNGDVIIDAVKNTIVNSASNYRVDGLWFDKFITGLYLSNYNGANAQIYRAMVGEAAYTNLMNEYQTIYNEILADEAFYKSNLNAFEHKGASIRTDGKLNLSASGGALVRGARIYSQNGISIESKGSLNRSLTSREVADQFNAGILVDGYSDSYAIGEDTQANFEIREKFNNTILQSGGDIKLNSYNSDMVLQGTSVNAGSKNVDLISGGNIVLLTGQDESYKKSTNVTKKKTWYGKSKYISTMTSAEKISGKPVDIFAKNINIDAKGDAVLYSTEMKADGGLLNIQAANIKLLTTQDVVKTESVVRKKSSFRGFKYNDSTTTSSFKQFTSLPVSASADYINTRSAYDTMLQGVVFNYLKSATIQAGNNIYIEPLTNRVEETLNKKKNSVVWQSMQDSGSIVETAKLPSFNGPAPTFIAGGGIMVQIPISETDKDRVLIRDAVLELAKKPEFSYLNTLAQDPTINWNQLILANKDWDIKQEGLTPAGAALLAIAVTIATGGAGAGSVFASMGTMGSAAMTSLTVQASIALVNNKGNLGATFKDLATSDTVKGMVTAALTAGLTQNIATQFKLPVNSDLLGNRVIVGMVNGTSSALVNTAINGGSLSDNLQAGLLAGVATAIQGELAQNIKGLEDTNYILHKIAHAAAGCATATLQKQACEAGAIGAAVGEIVAGELNDGSTKLTDLEKEKIINKSKLAAGVIAAYAGYDVDSAVTAADIAVRNNNTNEARIMEELDSLWIDANYDKELYFIKVNEMVERDALALDILTMWLGAGAASSLFKPLVVPSYKNLSRNQQKYINDYMTQFGNGSDGALKLLNHINKNGVPKNIDKMLFKSYQQQIISIGGNKVKTKESLVFNTRLEILNKILGGK